MKIRCSAIVPLIWVNICTIYVLFPAVIQLYVLTSFAWHRLRSAADPGGFSPVSVANRSVGRLLLSETVWKLYVFPAVIQLYDMCISVISSQMKNISRDFFEKKISAKFFASDIEVWSTTWTTWVPTRTNSATPPEPFSAGTRTAITTVNYYIRDTTVNYYIRDTTVNLIITQQR
jgi:hypothetical protein